MDSASAAVGSIILKIVFAEEVHRVRLNGKFDFTSVQEVLHGVWPGPGLPRPTYVDEEGDRCSLVESTFPDFLSTAKPSGRHQLLRLRLLRSSCTAKPAPATAPPVTETRAASEKKLEFGAELLQGSSPPVSSSDPDEEEALALARQMQLAGQQVLAIHLQEWLASEPISMSYEAWLGELHPENCQDGTVDPRMYFQTSVHLRLWNTIAAGAPGLADEDRDRLRVKSVEASLSGSPSEHEEGGDRMMAASAQPTVDSTLSADADSTRPTPRATIGLAAYRRAGKRKKHRGLHEKIKSRIELLTSLTGLGYLM